jgi:hypothetical protein
LSSAGTLQCADGGFVAQRTFELGAFALGKVQAQAHGIRHGEDVGKQDGGIQRKTLQRLQGDFSGVVRAGAQAHEAAGTRARWHGIPADSGQPGASSRWGVFNRLLQERTQEGVILELGHVGIGLLAWRNEFSRHYTHPCLAQGYYRQTGCRPEAAIVRHSAHKTTIPDACCRKLLWQRCQGSWGQRWCTPRRWLLSRHRPASAASQIGRLLRTTQRLSGKADMVGQ